MVPRVTARLRGKPAKIWHYTRNCKLSATATCHWIHLKGVIWEGGRSLN